MERNQANLRVRRGAVESKRDEGRGQDEGGSGRQGGPRLGRQGGEAAGDEEDGKVLWCC